MNMKINIWFIILVAVVFYGLLQYASPKARLFRAIDSGDYEKVVWAIEHGADVNGYEHLIAFFPLYELNETPLIRACECGNDLIIKYLLEQGADPNKMDGVRDAPPLLYALRTEFTNRYDTAFLLIDYGADINFVLVRNGNKITNLLSNTISIFDDDDERTKEKGFELFQYLYENQVDQSVLTPGKNLLTYAVLHSNIRVIRYLLENDIFDINSHDGDGNTALIVAAQYSEIEIAEFLIEKGADRNLTDREGKTALDYALENDNNEMARICNSLSGESDERGTD